MAIRNRNGKSVDEELAVPKKRGRPKKTEVEGPKIYPAAPTGAFHEMFPYMLEHKEDKFTKRCYFQCESHLNKHIERHKLERNAITIGVTPPRTY